MSEQHYFSSAPNVPARERQHTFEIRGREYMVTTAAGVFSADRLDLGTRVLLNHVPTPPEQGRFADVGCGWGPITLALADAAPQAEVLATDVNERSLELTRRNAQAHDLRNVRAVQAEALLEELRSSDTRLDLIWSNPPVRIGKEAMHQLLMDWLELLADDGEAWLVVQKNLGADSLAIWLGTEGWNVSKEASSKGYRILRVTH